VDRDTRLAKNVIEKLLERRWLLIALLCAVGIVFETLDNLVDSEPFDGAYIRETVFFGLIYPIGVGWLLTALLRARTERDGVLRQQKLVEDMMVVPSWTMLLDTIVAIPRRVAPVVAVGLYLQLDEGAEYSLVAAWSLLKPDTEFRLKDIDPLQTSRSTQFRISARRQNWFLCRDTAFQYYAAVKPQGFYRFIFRLMST
jgi:hypothetical protein